MRKLGAVLLMVACGDQSTPTAVCKGTVTGQIKGTFSVCNDYSNLYLQNMDTWSFNADYTELPTSFVFSTDWTAPGNPCDPKTMTGGCSLPIYNEQTPGIACSVKISKGKLTWVGTHGGGSVASGTCLLDFRVPDGGVTSLGQMGNTEAFKLHGTLSGHLEADPTSGSTGTVDVTMDFDG